MSWETFWAPNLVQWVVGGGVTAIVAGIVGVLVRRWMTQWLQQIFGEQQRTTDAAETAASRAGEALDASQRAANLSTTTGDAARTAADNSRQANELLEWLVPQIAARDAVIEELKERVDRLLGTRARQLATSADEHPTGLLIPIAAADENDPATVTGKHRLHTQRIRTLDERDPA